MTTETLRIPIVFTFPAGLVFWVVYLWAFRADAALIGRGTHTTSAERGQDRASLRVISLLQFAAVFAAFVVATRAPQAAAGTTRLAWYWAGVALLIMGALLRRHCFRLLGNQFTAAVRVRAGDELIERGLYRWIRHPAYSGSLLTFIGMGVALGNWASLALLSSTTLVAYAYRIRVEERALIAVHGATYQSYRARTRYLIPFLF